MQALEAIPKEIDEAAFLDGCSTLRIIWRFILPLSRPSLAAAAMLAFLSSWNDYITASVMISSNHLRPVQLAIHNYLGFYGREWGALMSSSILAIFPVIIVFIYLSKHFVSGLAQGAVQ
jgi:multiple sugar transport system permease protein